MATAVSSFSNKWCSSISPLLRMPVPSGDSLIEPPTT